MVNSFGQQVTNIERADANTDPKRIYQIQEEGNITSLNTNLRQVSEDLATLQGKNGPQNIDDRVNIKSVSGDVCLSLHGGNDQGANLAEFRASEGTMVSKIDSRGHYWNDATDSVWQNIFIPFTALGTLWNVSAPFLPPDVINWHGYAAGPPPFFLCGSLMNNADRYVTGCFQPSWDWKEGTSIIPKIWYTGVGPIGVNGTINFNLEASVAGWTNAWWDWYSSVKTQSIDGGGGSGGYPILMVQEMDPMTFPAFYGGTPGPTGSVGGIQSLINFRAGRIIGGSYEHAICLHGISFAFQVNSWGARDPHYMLK